MRNKTQAQQGSRLHADTRRPVASTGAVRRRMQATRQRDTPGEIALRLALRELGLRYRVEVAVPGTRRRADVAFIRAKVAVFIDGCFWHGCPIHGTWPKTNAQWWRAKIEANQRRDRDTDAILRASGWTVMRFWEHTEPGFAALRVAEVMKKAG